MKEIELNLNQLVIDLDIIVKNELSFREGVALSIVKQYCEHYGYCELSISDIANLLNRTYMHTSRILSQLKSKKIIKTGYVDNKKVFKLTFEV
jgi:hypothetical protein